MRLKFAPKSENKTYDHFTPISGQASALLICQDLMCFLSVCSIVSQFVWVSSLEDCIILGSGITGLAAGYISGWKIFEQLKMPGGICGTYGVFPKTGVNVYPQEIRQDIFRFEIGGGHWLWGSDKQALAFLKTFGRFRKYARRVSVYLPELELLVPYPLQYNLWKLPRGLAKKAFEDLVDASREEHHSRTMDNWLVNVFGQTLYDLFFLPFNTLYTSGLLKQIAPQDAFKNPIDVSKVEQGLVKNNNISSGYNSTFMYPRATWGVLTRRIASKCNILYGQKVSALDLAKKTAYFEDGSSVHFKKGISTLPLNVMASIAHLDDTDVADPYTSVLVANIAGPKGNNCPMDQWIYFPKSRTGFHRVGVYTNVDSLFLPSKLRNKGWASFYVEKSYFIKSTPSFKTQYRVACDMANELVEMGYLETPIVISPTWVEVAYTWRRVGSKWVERSLSCLKKSNIFQVGRYAEWGKYQGMLDSIVSARSFFNKSRIAIEDQ